MAACAVTGVLLIQSALKAGALAAPVAVLTVGDPLPSVGIAVIVGGVVVLAGLSTAASSQRCAGWLTGGGWRAYPAQGAGVLDGSA